LIEGAPVFVAVADDFFLKLIIGGGGGIAVAIWVVWLFSTGRIVFGKTMDDAIKRLTQDCERQTEELVRSLAYERQQKQELQDDNERWILRYTESRQHVRRAKRVAAEAVSTAKEIVSRSNP
jgi:hypothetical protein